MATRIIATLVESLLEIPNRLASVVTAYLLSLMTEAPKHTLTYAASTAGGSKARYARLLLNHPQLAKDNLLILSRRVARRLAKLRKPLVKRTPWTVAIIVDATLHPRSSRHVHNAQRLSQGQGMVIGHQWTNVVLLVAGRVIPLPPIPFLTKSVCRERGVAYRTAIDQVVAYLEGLELSQWIGLHRAEEIVVLTDAFYDVKKVARAILGKGWAWVSALHSVRAAKTLSDSQIKDSKWRPVDALFRAVRKSAPWQTVRTEADGGRRRRTFRARKLIGRLRGVRYDLALVCSEKDTKKRDRRYLACSVTALDLGVIIRTYQLRWSIEVFHRVAKGQLGMLDAGLTRFEAVEAHVHWVYCAYILLGEMELPEAPNLIERQRRLRDRAVAAPWVAALKKVAATRTQYGGARRARRIVAAALETGHGL